jgi:hypothetical protein
LNKANDKVYTVALMDTRTIIDNCKGQQIQNALTHVIKSFIPKGSQYITRDDIFKINMYICKFIIEPKFTAPKPTMFTVHGSFERGVECPDELHEMDIQTCILPIPPIMQIKSNYGHVWHESFKPKVKPKKKKMRKKKRGVQGNGSSFNSQATVTVALNDGAKVIGVKIFRKLKYVIPHCVELDNSDAKKSLMVVIDAMNNTWPGRDYYVNWNNMKTPMHNFKYQLRPDPELCVSMCGKMQCKNLCQLICIDLSVLTDILKVIWRDENMVSAPDREETSNYAGLLVRFRSGNGIDDGNTVTICIQKSGKITMNGTVSVQYYMAIYEWCNWIITKYEEYIIYRIKPFVDIVSSDDDGDK